MLRPTHLDSGASSTSDSSAVSNRSVLRACEVLNCFDQGRRNLDLAQIATQTGLSKATAYRLLATLVRGGMLELLGKNSYALAGRPLHRRSYRVGYASESEEFSFSRLVSESIRSSAYEAGLELLEMSNRYSPTIAVRNADHFVQERVDLVIEFQIDQKTATTVASRLIDADIPIIAIEIPHPGALFYGANNYRAGIIAGHALAQACLKRWRGGFDELILLELPAAGPLVRSRLTGMIEGLRELLPDFSDGKILFLNGNGRFERSTEVVRKYLRRGTKRRVLLGGINDPSCLGALSAFDEAGRTSECLAVSHNGAWEARRELRRPNSGLVGAVGYFPEKYGGAVIQLALDKLQGRKVPSASFVRHELLNRETVNKFYPNDNELDQSEGDSLLYSLR
jgi:ribose transport system substrate-binding protein